jgi:parvulin-like peptidyl-prolyl isomerase
MLRPMKDVIGSLPAEAYPLLQRHNLLKKLVRSQVVEDAVSSVTITAQELAVAREEFFRTHRLSDEASVTAFLTERGLSAEALEWQIQLPLKLRRHYQEHYRHKAESHFLTRKTHLDRVVYSLLRMKDPCLARELYLRIAGNEATFADLAEAFSTGVERLTKGLVGPVPLTQAHPALAERLRVSRPGVLQEPFSLEGFWLIVRLESYHPASFDEATADQMSAELFEQWVKQETSRRLASIQINANSHQAE